MFQNIFGIYYLCKLCYKNFNGSVRFVIYRYVLRIAYRFINFYELFSNFNSK